jgi:WD40 repeat protein
LQAVLDDYGRHRLLTFDRDPTSRTPTVEVAHEALLTEWERFAGWVDDARDDLLSRRRLEAAAHEWTASGSDPSFLYRGGRLELTESWARGSGLELTDDEHRFLATSRGKADRDRVVRNRRRRRVLGVLAAALVVAMVGAGVAFAQRQSAERAGTLAEARRIGTQALVADGYDRALLMAVEGRHLVDSPETRQNLLATIERSPYATAVIRSETDAIIDIGLTPDGKTLVAGGTTTMSKYDVTTRHRDASMPAESRVSSAVSPDGRLIVMSSGSGDGFALRLVDTATFAPVGDPLPVTLDEWPTRLTFSPDGKYIGAVTDQNRSGAGLSNPVALVWDVAKGGGPILQYHFTAENFQRDIAFLPDSQRILVAGADGTALIDIASGSKVGAIDGAHAPIAVNRDGTTLAAATDVNQGTVIGLFDLKSGDRQGTLAGHRERLVRLAFSPDGTELASGGGDRLVMLWDVATGERRAIYEGHAAAVNALAFSPDGNTLWSGGNDGALISWDLDAADSLVHHPTGAALVSPVLPFSSTDMIIAPGGRDVTYPWADDYTVFMIRDVATGGLRRSDGAQFTSFSADGKR